MGRVRGRKSGQRWVLSGDVLAGEKSGAQQNIPILTGITADFAGAIVSPPVSASAFSEAARKQFGKDADRFLALYPASSDTEATNSQRAALTDATAWVHTEWAAAHTRAGHRSYLYVFIRSVPPPANARTVFTSEALLPKCLGAWHTGEIPYAFDTLRKLDRLWPSADERLADLMSSYWVTFTTRGHLNGAGLPQWPVYGDQEYSVMELGDPTRSIPSLLSAEKTQFWADYFHEAGVTRRRWKELTRPARACECPASIATFDRSSRICYWTAGRLPTESSHTKTRAR